MIVPADRVSFRLIKLAVRFFFHIQCLQVLPHLTYEALLEGEALEAGGLK